jgi:hypothetical protein
MNSTADDLQDVLRQMASLLNKSEKASQELA